MPRIRKNLSAVFVLVAGAALAPAPTAQGHQEPQDANRPVAESGMMTPAGTMDMGRMRERMQANMDRMAEMMDRCEAMMEAKAGQAPAGDADGGN